MVFPFPVFGGFNFDARELSIYSIDDAEREGSEDSQPDAAKRKRGSRAATDDESCNRNLVWRDWRFAKERDNRGFDRRVKVSRQIERSVLCGIENDALSQAPVLRRKTKWPHAPAHADDVIVNFRRVQGVDFTGLDLLFELLNNRSTVRACQKEIPC